MTQEIYLPDNLNRAEAALFQRFYDPQPSKRMLDFTCATFPQYRPEPFHAELCVTLDDVLNGKERFVIVTAPPQHGKSEVSSVRFPAMHLGQNPDIPIMIASYGADLAQEKGGQVRDLVESEEYAKIFQHIKTRDDSRAVGMWKIEGHRAFVKSVGVGGGLTGHGAGLGIIDDPFKGEEEAYSQTIRDNVWKWYNTTFRNRIWPGGKIFIIMTRWHDDDLVGRLMNSPGWERWKIVRLPAIAETQEVRDRNNLKYNIEAGQLDPIDRQPGEALCPELRPLDFLNEVKETYSGTQWSALYQGAPGAAEGNRIKRQWLEDNIVDHVPVGEGIFRVRYWDKAGSDKKKADYTVGILMAYDPKDNLFYIENMVRGQWTIGSRDEVMLTTAEEDHKKYDNTVEIWHEQEPGSAGKDVADLIDKMLKQYPVAHEPATGSKEVRGEPFATAAEHGRIRIYRGKWNIPLIDELVEFPTGQHDDIWDACAGAYNKLSLKAPKRRKMKVR